MVNLGAETHYLRDRTAIFADMNKTSLQKFGTKGERRRRQFISWKFHIGKWFLLPTLGFWRVNILSISKQSCRVSLPYSWRTKNPFKSTYFAALNGAGELSTGALLQCYLTDHEPYSMLVIETKMNYFKKATDTVVFICEDGARIAALIKELKEKPQTIKLRSEGRIGDIVVCSMEVLWSIKLKR